MMLLRKILFYCFILPWLAFRQWVVARLIRLQVHLKTSSLRGAIRAADQDKTETGSKNMVVYNTTTGDFEPVRKRLLKYAAKRSKNTSNKAHTPGRKRQMKPGNTRYFTTDRVRTIEKKSPYVTN
jgi:hypothetical protein